MPEENVKRDMLMRLFDLCANIGWNIVTSHTQKNNRAGYATSLEDEVDRFVAIYGFSWSTPVRDVTVEFLSDVDSFSPTREKNKQFMGVFGLEDLVSLPRLRVDPRSFLMDPLELLLGDRR